MRQTSWLAGLALLLPLAAGQTLPPTLRNDPTVRFGLPDSGLTTEAGLELGFLPDWSHEDTRRINSELGRSISVVGDYIQTSPRSYNLQQVDWHLPSILRISNKPVYAMAVLFNGELSQWTPDITRTIAAKCAEINRRGLTVWLRLLFEMNGYWMAWGLDPVNFKQVWQDVTIAVRAQTNETYMLWAPNIWTGDLDSEQGYTPYWPGEQYVDIAGLSMYSRGTNDLYNALPADGLFTRLFTPFHAMFAPSSAPNSPRYSNTSNPLNLTTYPSRIPVVIAETSAPYYYIIPSNETALLALSHDSELPDPVIDVRRLTPSSSNTTSSPSERDLKATWFTQMANTNVTARFPNYIMNSWFNYVKRGQGEIINDFRAVGGNEDVEAWFRGMIGNETAYQAGYTGTGAAMTNSPVLALAFAGVAAVGLALW